jgi:hypothetical protein
LVPFLKERNKGGLTKMSKLIEMGKRAKEASYILMNAKTTEKDIHK